MRERAREKGNTKAERGRDVENKESVYERETERERGEGKKKGREE
jgi:hypothetical protein